MSSSRFWVSAAAAFALIGAAPAGAQEAANAGAKGAADQVCIAVVQPLVTGVSGQAEPVASSVRALFVTYLSGPSMKAIPLDARLPSQAAEEARQKGCPRVLTIKLSEKRSGDHRKLADLTHAAGTAAGYVPYAGGGGIAVGATVAGTEAVSAVAGSTRAKDEFTLEYRVTATDGSTVLSPKSDKAKAASNGEDLITPLVAKAAEAIAAAVGKK